MSTLGELLPTEHASLLTDTAKNLTKDGLETAVNTHPNSSMTEEDMGSIRKVAITRINGGQTPFTYTSHNFTADEGDPQDPNTCSCV